jgi:hypothetical protein
MQEDTPKSRSLLVLTVFALYTAGFYVYSLLVFHGMTPFLRGYIVWAAAIAIPFLAVRYIKIVLNPGSHRGIDALMWLFLAYVLVWMLLINADKLHPVEFNDYVGVVVTWTMLFMLGRVLPVDVRGLKLVALMVFGLMLALTLAFTEDGAFVPAQSADTFATYQAYAFMLVLVTFVLLYEVDRELVFSVIAIVAITSFAILGSRSEIVAMMFAAIIILNLRRISVAGVALQIITASVLYFAYLVLASTDSSRVPDIAETGADSALSSRAALSAEALATILASPYAGNFGSYEEGGYAHNILSIWVDFGIVGFALYVLLMLWSILAVLFGASTPLRDRQNVVAIGIWAFCALLLATTKAWHYFVVPFVIGLLASHRLIANRASGTVVAQAGDASDATEQASG